MSSKLLAGRYELIEKIGEGGMAVVYKGKDRLLNRYVAIKILRPEFLKDEKFIDNFRKESQAAAGLAHPNIVAVYDVGQELNVNYIVMELIEGKALSDIIKEKGKIPYKEAINIARQVASALSLAHKNQIVHRDVKPHNIMITSTGVAKLADFGIAKAVSASTVVGNENKVMGSVHYFSPEQARGTYVDERSDIYSLGVVLFEMLTGKVPFDGDNPVSVALMHINNNMPLLSEFVSGMPPQLEKIIAKATEKYQNNRYKNADEMIAALDDIEFITKVMGQNAFKGQNIEGTSVSYTEPSRDRVIEKIYVEKKRPSKKFKIEKFNIFLISAIAAVSIAIIIGLGFMLGWFGNESKEVSVPSFIGKTYEQAEALAKDNGLVLERGEDVYSPDQEEGKITSQNPTEGAKVAEGKVITVAVSKGKKDSVVPKLIGMDYNEAKEYVKQFGFSIGIVEKDSSTLAEGTIIRQSVKAGDSADKGTVIDVVISDGKGKEMVKAPKLIGLTPDAAQATLEAIGLSTNGIVTYEEVEDVAENTIFWQSIEPGKKIEVGSTIDYKVSKAVPEFDDPEDSDDEMVSDDPTEEGGR